MSTVLEQYRHAVSEFDDRVQKVESHQWLLPTPCAEWTVRQLVGHVVTEQCSAPYLVAGERIEDIGDRFASVRRDEDLQAEWARASASALQAFGYPGALDCHVRVSMGEISARDHVWQLTVALTVHAWDLARAIGADERLDPELVRRIWMDAEKNLDDTAAGAVFGRPVMVPAGADLQARMLALFGRRS